MEDFISAEEIKKFERIYIQELQNGRVSYTSKFNFAWCLVKSRYSKDIQNGILLLEELCVEGETEGKRDYLFYLAFAHAQLKEYPKALEYANVVLSMEPTNRQVIELKKTIKGKMETEGLKGMAIAGGALVGLGAIIGLGVALAKR